MLHPLRKTPLMHEALNTENKIARAIDPEELINGISYVAVQRQKVTMHTGTICIKYSRITVWISNLTFLFMPITIKD